MKRLVLLLLAFVLLTVPAKGSRHFISTAPFDAAHSDFIRDASFNVSLTTFTACAWWWFDGANGTNNDVVFDFEDVAGLNGLRFSVDVTAIVNTAQWGIVQGGTGSSRNVARPGLDSAWHTVCVTRNGTAAVLFLDAVQADTNTIGAGAMPIAEIGVAAPHGGVAATYFFAGRIAEMAIWNVVLTASEITSYGGKSVVGSNAVYSIRPGHLVLYYPLTGASGSSTEADESGGKFNGTISGSPTITNHCPCGRKPYSWHGFGD